MSNDNNDKKTPIEMVTPILMLTGWFLYSGETIGRNGGASRTDDPYIYWGIIALLIGFVLYKVVEYFDL